MNNQPKFYDDDGIEINLSFRAFKFINGVDGVIYFGEIL
jgi:hypothetical protein